MTFERRPTPTTAGNGSGPATGPPTQTCALCIITPQTIATSPANRARTRIGVGEEIELTVSPGPATWAVSGGNGSLNPSSGTKVLYTAGDMAGSVTITANGPGCTCTIALTIVEPANWTMKRVLGTILKHTSGIPDCGWWGSLYVHPNDVNFYRVEIREKDSLSVATGSYHRYHNGQLHGNYPPPDHASQWFLLTTHTAADGSQPPSGVRDQVYSGYPPPAEIGTAPPFTVGQYYWPITWEWRVSGSSNIHSFPVSRQEHEIFSNGRCESRKGGNTESTNYNDPTGTPF